MVPRTPRKGLTTIRGAHYRQCIPTQMSSSSAELQVAALRAFINHVHQKTCIQIPTADEAGRIFSSHVQRIIRSEIDKMASDGKTTGYMMFKTREQAEHAMSLLSENGYDVQHHNTCQLYIKFNIT